MPTVRRVMIVLTLVFCIAFVAVLPALAAYSQFTINILPSMPTFNRTTSDCVTLSTVGTDVHYTVLHATVSADGVYIYDDMSIDDLDPATPDGFVQFYTLGGFNPASPQTNCVTGSDDGNALNLTAGDYSMVVSTYENGATGPFTFSFDGPGTISIVESAAACPIPLPADSVVYNVPAGAPAFFAPDLASQTDFNLPAGTWWITQFEGDFAQVWIACQANLIWIPTNAIAR